jgi:flagellar biosynthesis protein FlhG
MSFVEHRALLRRVLSAARGASIVIVDAGARFAAIETVLTGHARERVLAVAAGSDPIALASTFALAKVVHQRHPSTAVDVLVNRLDGSDASQCHDAIAAGARQFLGLAFRRAGAVPQDSTFDAARRAGMSFPDAIAGSPAALAAAAVVDSALAAMPSTRAATR